MDGDICSVLTFAQSFEFITVSAGTGLSNQLILGSTPSQPSNSRLVTILTSEGNSIDKLAFLIDR